MPYAKEAEKIALQAMESGDAIFDSARQDVAKKALADYLMRAEHQNKREQAERDQETLREMQRNNPKSAVRAGEYSINPEPPQDGLTRFLALDRFKAGQEERVDRATERFGKRLGEARVTGAESGLARARQAIPATGAIPGQGMVSGRLPTGLVKFGEDMEKGIKEYTGFSPLGWQGAGEARAATEQAILDTRNLVFGGTLTANEEKSASNALADMESGDPDRMRRGLAAVADMSARKAQLIEQTTPAAARDRFKETGARMPSERLGEFRNYFGGAPANEPAGKVRVQRGGEVLEIDPSDLQSAIADGYQAVR